MMVDLKGMSKKSKIEYIWDYYKIHIITGIIVVIGLISFVHGQITKIDYQFNLTIIGSSLDDDKIAKFEGKLTNVVLKNPTKKQSAQIDIMSVASLTDGKDETSSQYIQKFVAELSANILDLLIINKKDYDSFQKQGGFLRLDNLEGLDLSSVKEGKIEETSEKGEKGVYAVNVQDNKLLTSFGVNTKDKVLCIPANSKQKDKAILAIKWIIENK